MNWLVYILSSMVIVQASLAYFVFSRFPSVTLFKIKGLDFRVLYVVGILLSFFVAPLIVLVLFVNLVKRLFKPKRIRKDDIDILLRGFR